MRAARYYAAGDIRIEDVPGPSENVGPRDVLVAPRSVGICGTDLHEYMAGPLVTPVRPHPLTGATLPQILGHEFAADVALECAGNEKALIACIDAVRPRGTISQVGLHVKPAAIDPMRLAERELSIVGTWCYPVQEWPRITAQVASGAFPVEKVITDRIGLADTVTRGFDVLVDPASDHLKILVKPD